METAKLCKKISRLLLITTIAFQCCTNAEQAIEGQPNTANTEDSLTKTHQPAVMEITKFLTYNNSIYDIKINYPSDWIQKEFVFGALATFLSPEKQTSGLFRENVNVIVEDLSISPMSLEEYTELAAEQIKKDITDVKILYSNTIMLNGRLAQKIVYSGTFGIYHLRWMQIFILKDNKAYVVTCTAEENTYNDLVGTFEEIVNSFKFI